MRDLFWAVFIAFFLCAMPGGCADQQAKQEWDGPRVFSIGHSPALSYNPEHELTITVEGLALANSGSYGVDVVVSGAVSPRPFDLNAPRSDLDDYFYNPSATRPNTDLLHITLTKRYLQRTKTSDSLNVTVIVHERPTPTLFQRAMDLAGDSLSSGQKAINAVWPSGSSATQPFLRPKLSSREIAAAEVLQNSAESRQNQFNELKGKFDDMLRAKIASREKATVDEINQQAALAHVGKLLDDGNEIVRIFIAGARDVSKIDPTSRVVDAGKAVDEAVKESGRLDDQLKRTKDTLAIKRNELQAKAIQSLHPGLKREISSLEQAEINFSAELRAARSKEATARQAQQFALAEARAEAEKSAEEATTASSNLEQQQGNLRTIMLQISDAKLSHSSLGKGYRVAAVSSRKFTLFQESDYRSKYEKARVSPNDINAFPLPEREAQDLFGPKIAKNYFVVRLSLRNSQNVDKLVNTGMIKASGRALVETTDKKPEKRLRFTVPIEIAPHSKEQIYTVLDDTSVNETRSVVFRTLEFAGTLASGYTLGFDASDTALRAIDFATGIGIPALNKLWVDRMPGYKRNVVNYGMNDLVKLPQNGTTSHKFLFFPRSKLEAIIIDQNSYGDSLPRDLGFKQPNTYIAYLTFDNMDIPFEDVTQAASGTLAERVVDDLNTIRLQVTGRQDLVRDWTSESAKENLSFEQFAGLSPGMLKALKQKVDLLKTNAPAIAASAGYKPEEVASVLDNLTLMISTLTPGNPELKSMLIDDPSIGLSPLQSAADRLNVINGALAHGDDPNRYLAEYEATHLGVMRAQTALSTYKQTGHIMKAQFSNASSFVNLAGKSGVNPSELKSSLADLIKQFADLDVLRTPELRNRVMKDLKLINGT